jgi:hypothetical protein
MTGVDGESRGVVDEGMTDFLSSRVAADGAWRHRGGGVALA